MTIPAGYQYNDAVLFCLEQAIVTAGGSIPVRDGRTWNDRRTQLTAYLATLQGGAATDVEALTDFLSSGTWIDPGGNHLSGTPSFSSGWTLTLLGGAGTSVSDPFDGAHLIGSPLSTLATGAALTTSDIWSIAAHLLELSPPDSLSSDINIAMGLCDEDADSATINAAFIGLTYSGGSRALLKGRVTAGVVSSNTGAANNSMRAHQSLFFKQGNGSGGNVRFAPLLTTRAIDAQGDSIAGVGAGAATPQDTPIGNFTPRPFLAAWRSSTTDGTARALSFRSRRGPFLAHAAPIS